MSTPSLLAIVFLLILAANVWTASSISDIEFDKDPRIVNGMNTNTSVIPFIVSLRGYYTLGSSVIDHRFCGASLINVDPPIVLTAAHCVESFVQYDNGTMIDSGYTPPYIISIHMDIGRTKAAHPMPNTNYQTLNLNDLESQLFIHEDYNDTTLTDDIALMIFRNQTLRNDTKYAMLPDQYSGGETCCKKNEDLLASGWGDNKTDGAVNPKKLQVTTLQYQKPDLCRARYGWDFDKEYKEAFEKFYGKVICAGGNNTDVCQGDSGGPLFRVDGDQFEVIGATSFTWGDCNTNGPDSPIIPSGFTGVGYYRNWIDRKIDFVLYGNTWEPTSEPTPETTWSTTSVDGSLKISPIYHYLIFVCLCASFAFCNHI